MYEVFRRSWSDKAPLQSVAVVLTFMYLTIKGSTMHTGLKLSLSVQKFEAKLRIEIDLCKDANYFCSKKIGFRPVCFWRT